MNWDSRRIETAIRQMSTRVRFCVSGELRTLVLTAMWAYFDEIRTPTSPVYRIDRWQDDASGILELIATSRDGGVAVTAYEAVVAKYPGANITLRSGIRVIRSTEDDRRRREIEG